MHSGCINAHDHITPKYQSIYQNLKGTFLQKMNECKHKKGYLCFIRKQRTNRLTKTGGNKGSLTLICIIFTN